MQERVSRRRFVATAGAATVTGFAGCGDQGEGEGGDGDEEENDTGEEDETGYG